MKGFKKDGKFRPTEKRVRKKHSQPKCSECGNKMGMLETGKCHRCRSKPTGKYEITETEFITRKKQSLEPKRDPRVEEQYSSGNSEEMIWWKVNDVSAMPDVDGKVIPLDFYIYTMIDQETHDLGMDPEPDTYIANLVAVPRKFGKEKWQQITDSVGDTPEVNEEVVNINDALSVGDTIPIRDIKGAKSSDEAINKVLENISADAGAIGFTLDRRLNVFGETGWDKLNELALDIEISTPELIDRQRKMMADMEILEEEPRSKKTIQVNQTEGQKHRADIAKSQGTHKHEGFNKLVKDIEKGDKSLSEESAKNIAGSIQAKSKKKFGTKTVSKGGKKHVEPAI